MKKKTNGGSTRQWYEGRNLEKGKLPKIKAAIRHGID
jgi:hypothetical protein